MIVCPLRGRAAIDDFVGYSVVQDEWEMMVTLDEE